MPQGSRRLPVDIAVSGISVPEARRPNYCRTEI